MKKLAGIFGASLLVMLFTTQTIAGKTPSNPVSPQFLDIYREIEAVFIARNDRPSLHALEALKNALQDHLAANQNALNAVEQLLQKQPDNGAIVQTRNDLLLFQQTLHHEYLQHILALGENYRNLQLPPATSKSVEATPSPDPEKNLFQLDSGGTDISIEIGAGDPHQTIME